MTLTLGDATRRLDRAVPIPVAAVTVLLSFAVVAYAVKSGYPLRYLDEREYLEIARGVADGNGYQLKGGPTAYKPPAWPLLLTPLIAIGVPERVLLVVPALLLVVAAVCGGRIAATVSRTRWGWVAAPLMIAYPLNLYVSTTLYPQAIATTCMLALWLLCTRLDGQLGLSWKQALSVGLITACLVLSVPTMAFSVALIGGWVLWKTPRGKRARLIAVAGIGFATPIAAWTVRNALSLGSFIVLSTSSGGNLLYGNNPKATPDSGTAADISAYLFAARGMSPVEEQAYYKSSAIDWIKHNPLDAFVLYIGKTANYFSGYNPPASGQASGTGALLIGWGSFLVLLAAVVLRLLLHRVMRVRESEKLFIAIFVLNAPVMAIFFTRTRFRQPLDATLIVEAAIGIVAVSVALARWRMQHKQPKIDKQAGGAFLPW